MADPFFLSPTCSHSFLFLFLFFSFLFSSLFSSHCWPASPYLSLLPLSRRPHIINPIFLTSSYHAQNSFQFPLSFSSNTEHTSHHNSFLLHFSFFLTKIHTSSPKFLRLTKIILNNIPSSHLFFFLTKIHLTKIPSSHQFHKIQRGNTSSTRSLITTWVKWRNYNSKACYICFLAFVTCLSCSPSFICMKLMELMMYIFMGNE
ncbi:hypothetical protein RchiOBHm_Chr4g0405531 [Rosa chinensis]|uniref:Uncharacterized protein n=1 Tax=Rosa chinensis TaxID=74649 RepID=A0A2P6QU33_ROSCH|nr:hypothetical protein RchiOBHm_Chr4g0405531 [Rosa chinensis]